MKVLLMFDEREFDAVKMILDARVGGQPTTQKEDPVYHQMTLDEVQETSPAPIGPVQEDPTLEEPAPEEPIENIAHKEITMADLRPLALKLIGEERRDELEALLDKFGVKKLKLLPKEHYPEAYALLKEAADNA